MRQRNPKQLAQILECMQIADARMKTDHINDIHDNIFGYRLKGMSDRMSKLSRNGYVTITNCKPHEIGVDGCIKWYGLTKKGEEKGVIPIIAYKSDKPPRSSTEEGIVKKQNKQINKEEWIKFEDFKKNYYWNAEEGKRERGIQIKSNLIEKSAPDIQPIRPSLLVRIKSLFHIS